MHVVVGSSTTACLARMNSGMVPLRAAQARTPDETIVLDIPSVPLTPGDYHLDVYAYDKRLNVLDEVRRAAEFKVIATDVLGNGYQFTKRDGPLMIPWDWEIRPSTPTADTHAAS